MTARKDTGQENTGPRPRCRQTTGIKTIQAEHRKDGAVPRKPATTASGSSDKGEQAPKAGRATPKSRKRGKAADERAEIRRSEILHAAFDVFAENGFTNTKLDEVARRAGIAKGTIYLYFPDKETLFVELLREAARPVLGGMQLIAANPNIPVETVLQRIHAIFVDEILLTKRKHLLRMLIQEGPRFPAVTEFYYRDIVHNALVVITSLARRGVETGELSDDTLVRYPQLVMAPLLTSVIWDALFEDKQHLDVEGMLAAFRKLLLAPNREEA
ncbi:TetR/AcrR family transcriptional regulator [Breoghania sp.]|uniref:TetR/AcrR family transcriptional regulator n=1 Tax=Breoghania sp. TaxID=2065378 RepID=UPI002AA5F239|nr:TetR/AcrR family transcriptional regulator [Breoghania sp.]